MTDLVRCDIAGGVARLTLNRPQAANAIDVAMADAIMDAAVRVAEDPSVRAVVLTGSGRLFCAGGDLQAFAADLAQAHAVIARITAALHAGILRLATMDKPLVTLVNGPAAGAGLGLALLGDVVIASSAAHFTSAYTAIGMSPDAATSWLLPRLVGLRFAQEMVLTNRRVGAEEALERGLVNAVAAPDALDAAVDDWLARLARAPVGALGASRRLLAEGTARTLADHLVRESASIAALAGAAPGQQAIRALLDAQAAARTRP